MRRTASALRREVRHLPLLTRRAALGWVAAGLSCPARALQAQTDPDVLVLGAGIGGLHAARVLQTAGATVQVLEGSHRVGGRCWTGRALPGRPEFGAGTVGTGYGRVRSNAAELGIELIAPPPGGRQLVGGVPPAFSIGGSPVSAEPWAQSALNRLAPAEKAMSPVALYRHYVTARMPLRGLGDWLDPRHAAAARLDALSLRDYFVEQGASPEALRLMDVHVPAARLDAANALHFVRTNLAYQFEERAGPGLKIAGGTSALTDAMARSLARPVLLRQVVVRIEARRDGVVVFCADGSRHRARACVSALPAAVLKGIAIDGDLPPRQRAAWMALRSTANLQIFFSVHAPFWQRDGAPPALWTDGPIEHLFHFPPPPSGADPRAPHGLMVAFVSGDGTRAFDGLAPSAAAAKLLRELARIRPAAAGALRFEHLHDWTHWPFSQGHIVSWAPGDIGRYGALLRQPVGALHFGGEHCGHLHVGLEAACEGSEAAALQVLDAIRT